MKLEYLLTEEDLLIFNDFHHKHSKAALNARRKSIAGFSISMFVVMVYLITKYHGFSLWSLILPAILAIILGHFYSIKLKASSRHYAIKAIIIPKQIVESDVPIPEIFKEIKKLKNMQNQ